MASPWENDPVVQPQAAQNPWEADPIAQDDPRNSFMGKVDAAMRGAADVMSFGTADEIAASVGSGSIGGLTPNLWGDYEESLAAERGIDQSDAENRFGYRLGGQVAGGLVGGAGLAKAGLSPTAAAISRGAGLLPVAATSAGEGAVMGAAQGFGSGEGGVVDRLKNAAVGGGIGAAAGLATPLAVSGVQKVAGMAAAPVMARIMPENYAQRAVGDALRRSGMSADDIAASLSAARSDGQDMFTVADAMGNAGQRMLSTVARNPSDARQRVTEALVNRQVGQGERLANYLSEGFDAPDTAAQRAASLAAQRKLAADANYGAARQGAGAVNLNGTLDTIDGLLRRDPILGETALSQGPMGQRLMGLRDRLQKGGEQLVDFDSVLNIKSDLYNQMQRNPNVASDLRPAYSQLDQALENSSAGYRNANDTFANQSRQIGAVDTGMAAASPRMRAQDTVPQFQNMPPEQQSAFRAGYVDPYIARIEASSMSPSTNKARMLITPKTEAEFPAFAAPGRADQMGNRIAREQRMFQTSNAALGGSKTADNLADAAEMSKFDPGVMSKMMRGDMVGALVDAVRRVGSEASGTPPRVIEHIADALMQTEPQAARDLLNGGITKVAKSDQLRSRVVQALLSAGAAGAGRVAAP